jgi:hypothetical protein
LTPDPGAWATLIGDLWIDFGPEDYRARYPSW